MTDDGASRVRRFRKFESDSSVGYCGLHVAGSSGICCGKCGKCRNRHFAFDAIVRDGFFEKGNGFRTAC